MKTLTPWLRSYLPVLAIDDAQLAEDLTLRGIAVEGVFERNDIAGDSDGAIFDMDITTNRVDAMNHYGVAREAAAIYNVPLHPLDTALPAARPVAAPYPVRIEAEDLCGRFTARVIRNVSVGSSEGRVEHWFNELGQKRILNAVDATNFVLLGMGHPTHAFDLEKVSGGIIVRRARPGETLRLLDGSTRTLVTDDLVVADEVKALGLAGVMGGWDSMITAETKHILVEAAWFEPATIRASSRRHLIHTDASHRFERGADFAAAPVANALVTKMILEACGGVLEGDLVDVVVEAHRARTETRPAIRLSAHEVRRHLGTTLAAEGISSALIERFLTALGCRLTQVDGEIYDVLLPSWRLDLTREIDLIEEIARVYGYNRFANTLPAPGVTVAHPRAAKHEAVRRCLLSLGFSEALSSSFASAAEHALYAPAASTVAMENPLNEEAAHLRASLVPGIVSMLAHNLNRDVPDVRLFEMGAIFSADATKEASATKAASAANAASATIEAVQEVEALALGLTGAVAATKLARADDASFYELKGAIEAVLALFDVPAPKLEAKSAPWLEAGRAAAYTANAANPAGNQLAVFGQLSSAEAARRKLRQPLWVASIDFESLYAFPLRRTTAKDLSRFQAVERDFSFVLPDNVQWADVASAIYALNLTELRSLRPVEHWRDEKKFAGVYSTLIRIVFQSQDRTLEAAELAAWSDRIIAALTALGGQHRGE